MIIDCFGMMHAPDQAAALAERAARLRPGGMLLLQFHSLDSIVRHGQWNALRHGHYAYYSATALTAMLAAAGLGPRTAWQFSLYGGTVLLAACRDGDDGAFAQAPDDTIRSLLAAEARTRVTDPEVVRGLQRDVRARAGALRSWLAAQKEAGKVGARLQRGIARGRAAAFRRRGQRPAARRGGRIAGKARAADAGNGDPRHQPG